MLESPFSDSLGEGAFSGCEALTQVTFADTSGWYVDEYFATKAGADELTSRLKGGLALYKKCADASAAQGDTAPNVVENLHATQADVNAKDIEGFSKLMSAVRNGTAAAVEELLDAGADVNAKNNAGTTALMLAVYHNRSVSVVRLLLDAGADVNAKNNSGKTALIFAAKYNRNPNVFKMLLSARADVNAKDKEGKTAIDYLEARDDKDKFIGTDVYQMMKKLL